MLFKLVVSALIVFGGFAAIMYLVQRRLMYFPDPVRTLPATAGFDAKEVTIETADGERIIAWHVPPKGGKPLILYFHGNAGALQHRVGRFRALVKNGNGLLAVSYRGYGGSSGMPTETGLLNDADAAYKFAAARYGAARIVPWGESLGSGVSVALAAKHPVARLVLESPFTSAADVGAAAYWFLPVRLLMKDQFRSDKRIGQVRAPVIILHGTADQVVPFALGERLFALANEPKRFVRFDGGGHMDLDGFGAQAAAQAFIAEAAR